MSTPTAPTPAPTPAQLAEWLDALRGFGTPGDTVDDATRVDQLQQLRLLENAVAAAQLRVAHAFDESQRAAQVAAGVPRKEVGRGIAEQVALARRQSPVKAHQFLGLARVLGHEMPHTAGALGAGVLDEWTATLLARETATLPLAVRRQVDADLVGSGKAATLSRKELVDQARKLAARLDNQGVADRQRLAAADRRVTLRPAPDTMTYLTALVPVAEGVAVYAALKKAADAAKATGEERTRGQLMADRLVELVTGRSTDTPPPVDLHLVMTERTLLGGDSQPAHLPGYGVVPAEWARDLVARAVGRTGAWVRRLFTAPGSGQLMAMDSRRRKAPAGLRAFITDRDRLCRTPWCGAPIRHVDHAQPYRDLPRTSAAGLQGLCEACNYAKEAIGWVAVPRPGPPHTVEITTPTGHRYLAFAPPPLVGGDDEAA